MPVATGDARGPVRARAALLLVVAAVVAACSAPTDESSPPTQPEPTTTTRAWPSDAASPTVMPSPLDTVTRTSRIHYGPHEEQVVDAYLPDDDVPSPTGDPDARPAMVFVHGGGWTGGERTANEPAAATVAALGWVAVTIDYRLAPAHEHPAAAEDVRAALQLVHDRAEELGIGPDRVVVAGDSAGGHLSGLVALSDDRPPVAAWVSWSGIYDVPSLLDRIAGTDRAWLLEHVGAYFSCDDPLGDACAEAVRSASPVAHASADDPPTLLLHSTDEIVPLANAEAMRASLEEAGVRVRLETFDGHAHGAQLIEPSTDEVRAFLGDVLDL